MKPKFRLALLVLFLALQPLPSEAIVGYYNQYFQPGANWFGNQLSNSSIAISFLIPTPPEGTTVKLWSTAGGLEKGARYKNGSWCGDFDLPYGQGAVLTTPTLFTNTFVGELMAPDGTKYTNGFTMPPPFAKPNGIYLLACRSPLSIPYDGTNVFFYILGRNAKVGESFTRLNPITQTQTKTTLISLPNTWDNGEPALNVGEAAFFNIGPAPEPDYRVTAITREGNNIRITWTSFGAHTNIVQVRGGSPSDNQCSDAYTDLSPLIVITATNQFVTNYVHIGGATNSAPQFYRIRLIP